MLSVALVYLFVTSLAAQDNCGDPPKVTKVSVKHFGATNITIYWERPRDYSYLCYPGYKVCYSARGDNKETCYYTLNHEFTTFPAVPLFPCTEYNFSVAAVDDNFAEDSKTSEKTHVLVVTAPQMPNVTVKVHNHKAHVTWQTPDTLSMACAARYEVRNCRRANIYSEECATISSKILPSNATEATIDNLDSCTNNHISIRLVSRNRHSSSIEVVVHDPESVIPVPSDIRVGNVATDQITWYYFKNKKDCVNSFRVCWFMDSEAETCRYTNITSSIGTFMNLNLKPCSNYIINFFSLGSGGRYSENFTTAFFTGPGKVENLTLYENTTAYTVSLSWVNPPYNQLCVEYIEVRARREYYFKYEMVKLSNNATTITLDDITPICSEYFFEVIPRSIDQTAFNIIRYVTICNDMSSSQLGDL